MALTVYTPPGVYSERNPFTGNPIVLGGNAVPTIVGVSGGQKTRVTASLTKADSDFDTIHATRDITEIINVSNSANSDEEAAVDGMYRKDIDYELYLPTAGGGKIHWLNQSCDAPSIYSATALNEGTLVAGTYYIKVAGIRRLTSGTYGETTPSTMETFVLTSTGGIRVYWNCRVALEGYRVYITDSTADPLWTDTRYVQVSGGGTDYYDIDGSLWGSRSGTPATVNATLRRPYTAQGFYCTYKYRTYDLLNATKYTSVPKLQDEHGIDSDIGVAGRLILAPKDQGGQGARECWVVGVAANTPTHHQSARAELSKIEEEVKIVPLYCNQAVSMEYLQHCINMGGYVNKKERTCVVGNQQGTEPGASSEADTAIYYVKSFSDMGPDARNIVMAMPDGAYVNVLGEDGSTTKTLYDGWILAAAYAGLSNAAADPATAITGQMVLGLDSLYDGTYDITDEVLMDNMATAGISVFYERRGFVYMRHAITSSLASIEDQEDVIVQADHYFIRLLRGTIMDAGLVAKKNTPSLRDAAKNRTKRVMDILIKEQIITAYYDLSVRPDETDPRKNNIAFRVEPVYPANQFIFKWSFFTAA